MINVKARLVSEAVFLRSNWFFRHQYQWQLWTYLWYGHYGDIAIVAIVTIDDVRPLILVSTEASGPQDCSPWSQFCLKKLFLGQRLKINADIFFLYKLWKSFVYFVGKNRVCGSTSSAPRHLKVCMAVYIHKKNGISFAAISSKILLHLGPP